MLTFPSGNALTFVIVPSNQKEIDGVQADEDGRTPSMSNSLNK